MLSNTKLTVAAASILLIVLVAAFDSRLHFSQSAVNGKLKVHSAQRNWSLFFGQKHVYYSGSFRHIKDFGELSVLIPEGSHVFADIATSYYSAAFLPVWVRNIHAHHGRKKSRAWSSLMDQGVTCYLDRSGNFTEFEAFLMSDELVNERVFFIVNKEQKNKNFSRDCHSSRRSAALSVLRKLGSLVFEGDTMWVFQLPTRSS